MRKHFSIALFGVLLLSGCATEMNNAFKSTDYHYRYEVAKDFFSRGKYSQAVTLLQTVINQEKGTEDAEESLYMLGMAEYKSQDYEAAASSFRRYTQSYPRGIYTDMARFYVGQSLYMSTPEPRLDQSQTVSAISSFQEYLDLHPDAELKEEAQQRLIELQDKLVRKELYSAQLYYDLGTYFGNCGNDGGNNYTACIVTAQNALKDYPYTAMRENFALLIMKSKYELAEQSVDEKKMERYQDAEDECYGFINEYPDSKDKSLAEKYIAKCKKFTKE